MTNHHRLLTVLSSLALLGSTVGCGQSVRPEFLDGASDDGPRDEGLTSTTVSPVCQSRADRDALFDQRCSPRGARTCAWDVCLELECKRARVLIDGGFVETDELRWGAHMVCNGPLPPPELEAYAPRDQGFHQEPSPIAAVSTAPS